MVKLGVAKIYLEVVVTTLLKGLSVSLVLLMLGCTDTSSSENRSESMPGACSQGTLDSYNAISASVEAYKQEGGQKKLLSIHQSCVAFQNYVGTTSCKALDTNTNQMMDINANRYACQMAAQMLGIADHRPPNPGLYTQGTSLTQTRKGITLVVRDQNALNRLMDHPAETLQSANGHCTFKARRNFEVRNQDVVLLNDIEMNTRGNKLRLSNKKLEINCHQNGPAAIWTVLDLQKSLGSIADVYATN